MKKAYAIKYETVDCEWGRHVADVTARLVYTDEKTAAELVEELKAEKEKIGCWWCGYGAGEDKRPNVWAEALEVEGL